MTNYLIYPKNACGQLAMGTVFNNIYIFDLLLTIQNIHIQRTTSYKYQIICPWLQHSLPSPKVPLEATSAQELFAGSFMKLVSMAEQSQKQA